MNVLLHSILKYIYHYLCKNTSYTFHTVRSYHLRNLNSMKKVKLKLDVFHSLHSTLDLETKAFNR